MAISSVLAASIGPGGWILVVLILAFLVFVGIRQVRGRRSSEDE